MAKGKSIYFTKSELENMNDFFNHWDDMLLPEHEEFYTHWFKLTDVPFGKIHKAIQNQLNRRLVE